MGPCFSNFSTNSCLDSGRRACKIFDPSNGEIGIKLNIASSRFINIITINKFAKEAGTMPNFITTINTNAMNMFESGPTAPIAAMPHLPYLIKLGLNGTGLPHPNPAINKNKLPHKSKWRIGFSVNLPSNRGVISPKNVAIAA